MAFLLELPSLAQIRLRIYDGETEIDRNLRPVQSETLQQQLQIGSIALERSAIVYEYSLICERRMRRGTERGAYIAVRPKAQGKPGISGIIDATYDIIRFTHLADRGGYLWSAGTSDHGFLARRLSGVDCTWFCRCSCRTVDSSSTRFAGTLSGADWHDELPDSVVHHRIRSVRRGDRVPNAPPLNNILAPD